MIIYNKHVVFGRVVEGIYVIIKFSGYQLQIEADLLLQLRFSNCGEILPRKDIGIVAVDEGNFIF